MRTWSFRYGRRSTRNVITTSMGKCVLDASNPRLLLTAGLRRQEYPQRQPGRADSVVAIGHATSELPPSAPNLEGRPRIVCIDTVPPGTDAHFAAEVEPLVWSDRRCALIAMHQRRKFGRIAGTRFDNHDLENLAARSAWKASAERAGDVRPPLAGALCHPDPLSWTSRCITVSNDKLAVDLGQVAPEALS